MTSTTSTAVIPTCIFSICEYEIAGACMHHAGIPTNTAKETTIPAATLSLRLDGKLRVLICVDLWLMELLGRAAFIELFSD